MATADLRGQTIYHEDSLRGTYQITVSNGATLLRALVEDMARHVEIDTDIKNWTCPNSSTLTIPLQKGNIDYGVFVCG